METLQSQGKWHPLQWILQWRATRIVSDWKTWHRRTGLKELFFFSCKSKSLKENFIAVQLQSMCPYVTRWNQTLIGGAQWKQNRNRPKLQHRKFQLHKGKRLFTVRWANTGKSVKRVSSLQAFKTHLDNMASSSLFQPK